MRYELLQGRLVVQAIERRDSGVQSRREQPLDEIERDRCTTVEVDRAEHGFHRIREDRHLLPTARGVFTTTE